MRIKSTQELERVGYELTFLCFIKLTFLCYAQRKVSKRKGVSTADKNITFLTAAVARPVRPVTTSIDFSLRIAH